MQLCNLSFGPELSCLVHSMGGLNVVEAKPSTALSSFGAGPCRRSREMGEQVGWKCGNFCSWDNETITRYGNRSNSTCSSEVEFVRNNPVAICSVFLLAPMFLQPSDSHLTGVVRLIRKTPLSAARAEAYDFQRFLLSPHAFSTSSSRKHATGPRFLRHPFVAKILTATSALRQHSQGSTLLTLLFPPPSRGHHQSSPLRTASALISSALSHLRALGHGAPPFEPPSWPQQTPSRVLCTRRDRPLSRRSPPVKHQTARGTAVPRVPPRPRCLCHAPRYLLCRRLFLPPRPAVSATVCVAAETKGGAAPDARAVEFPTFVWEGTRIDAAGEWTGCGADEWD